MTSVVDIVLPVFGLVILGYVAGKAGWIKPAAIEGLSSFVFTFAIPVMLFRSIATAHLPHNMPWHFLLAYYGATLSVYLSSFILAKVIGLGGVDSAIFAMSGSYSNVVLLGIPLTLASFGTAANIPLFIIVSTHAAIMFLVTTFSAETGKGEFASLASLPVQTIRVLLRNMIVIGLLLGLGVNLTGVTLPSTIDKMAAYLGGAALPCAVFSMGASISQYRISGDIGKISAAVIIKNLAHPLLVWFACIEIFHVPANWSAVLILLAACPTGVNAYLFANRYRVIVASTATVVVASTLASIVILSLGLAWLIPFAASGH